jgi:polysaccharide deacetylase 2 family uncharacterized protein YibQ
MATKKKPTRRKNPSKKQQPDRTFKVLLASLFLIAFLVVSLMILTFVQRAPQPGGLTSVAPPAADRSLEPEPYSASEPKPEPYSPSEPPQDHLLTSTVQLEIERALWRQGISFTGMDVREENGVTHYYLPAEFPGDAWYNTLTQALGRQSSQLETALSGAPSHQIRISLQGNSIFLLHFKRPDIKSAAIRPKAQIAIIVDDLGRDLRAVHNLLAIDLDLTMAVMPEEPHTSEAAELSFRAGREVLVHMPMEPESYPENNPGTGALLLGQESSEIKRRVSSMFAKVPHAVGGNNHMGSRFTQYPEGMQAVFEVMKEGGWFFVDSRTSPGSVAVSEARKADVATIGRDIFLDNSQNVDAIARQLREAVKIARSRRKVVAICHPYPETVQALRQEAAYLRQQDIQVVPVSRLLQR